MPTYEYECKSCSHNFEIFQSMSDPPLKDCPVCGKEIRRLIFGGSGVIFKGSGFYVTDKGKSSGGKNMASPKACDAKACDAKACDANQSGESKTDKATASGSAASGSSVGNSAAGGSPKAKSESKTA